MNGCRLASCATTLLLFVASAFAGGVPDDSIVLQFARGANPDSAIITWSQGLGPYTVYVSEDVTNVVVPESEAGLTAAQMWTDEQPVQDILFFKVIAAGCTTGDDCVSGFCSDDICCDTPCSSSCESCNQPGSEGTCTFIEVGQDPESECAFGTCDGSGKCEQVPFQVSDHLPVPGAVEVGVTVKPQVFFSRPVDASTLNHDNFYGSFAGEKLAATIVPSNDGLFAWLFFDEPMPNSSSIQVTVDGSTISSTEAEVLDADGDGSPGGVYNFSFSTVSVVPVEGTSLVGRIVDPGPDLEPMTADDFDAGADGEPHTADDIYLLPIAGVEVFVLGLEEDAVYTDADGLFTLDPVPVGNVKVEVNGLTATSPPPKQYFPEMVMDAYTDPGVENFVMPGMETMYLPRIASAILQPVDAKDTTMVTLIPEAAYDLPPEQQKYLTLMVPPDSLVGADGQAVPKGEVGISVVPPELVLDMLPPGVLQHSFDITVQASGFANFSDPATLTVPNVFGSPAGTTQYFLSFDHDTGRLVIEGTATVSEDGLSITSNPNTGVTHPGWHGVTPPGNRGRNDIPTPWSNDVIIIIINININIGTIGGSNGGVGTGGGGGPGGGNGSGSGGPGSPGPGPVPVPPPTSSLAPIRYNSNDYNPYVAGKFFICYSIDGEAPQRIRSDADGSFFVNLPSTTPYDITSYDPDQELVWNRSGTSGAAGAITHLGAPNFVPSTAPDVDPANGVPDDIDCAMGPGSFFDFGTASGGGASVAFNYQGVFANSYDPGAGYGWRSGTGSVLQTDRGTGSGSGALTRDFNAVSDRVFSVDVAPGLYDVTPWLGDPAAAQDLVEIYLEGQLRGTFATEGNEFTAGTFRVPVMDGQLDVRIRDAGGATTRAALNALDVQQVVEFNSLRGTESTTEPALGLHYFVLEDLDTGFILRGKTVLTEEAPFLCPEGVFLASNTRYKQWVVNAQTLGIGYSEFTTPNSGLDFDLPMIPLFPVESLDSDGDGLPDDAELIIGTNPSAVDTDLDGIHDLEEVQQGLDPVSGQAIPTGIIGSLPLAGSAREIVLQGSTDDPNQQTAYLAAGSQGLAVVDTSQALMPVMKSQLALPGDATDVAVDLSLNTAAVAGTAGGLHFVDVADPMMPELSRTVFVDTSQVEIVSGITYAAVGTELRAYDVGSGNELETLSLGGSTITGLARSGSMLYTMDTSRTLRIIDIGSLIMAPRGSLIAPVGGGKLFVGNDIAYIAGETSFLGGFATVDVSDPDNPTLLSGVDDNSIAARKVVLNGSDLAVGVGNAGGAALDVIDVSDPTDTGGFLARFGLPAVPFSADIGSGIAFVADGSAGLQVVNYLSVDTIGVPPTVSLSTSFPLDPPEVTEGKLATVTAVAADDVQVKRVEFFVGGVSVGSDFNFPFEHVFTTPLATQQSSFTLKARAVDTGGNSTETEEIVVDVVPDTIPPEVTQTSPTDAAELEDVVSVRAWFDEPLEPATVAPAAFLLTEAGPDEMFDTGDDELIVTGTVELRGQALILMNFEDALPLGLYRARIDTTVTDTVGNALAAPEVWTFTVADLTRPSVLQTSPPNGATGVPINTVITAQFNEPVRAETLTDTTFRLYEYLTGTYRTGTRSLDPTGTIATFVPDAPLVVNGSYGISLTSDIEDLVGNDLIAVWNTFTTEFSDDTTPPSLLGTTPANGDVDIPTNPIITVQFDEALDPISVNSSTIQLRQAGASIATSLTLEDSNRRVRVQPLATLGASAAHTLMITTGVRDLANNTLTAETQVTFTTGTDDDASSPVVTLVDPLNASSAVPQNAVARVTFSERVNPLTVTPSTFFIQQAYPSRVLSGTVEVAPDGMSATFTPIEPLQPLELHYVRTYNGIKDLAGNGLAGSTLPSQFTTSETQDSTGPTVTVVSPADGSTGTPMNTRVIVQVDELLSAHSIDADSLTLWDGGVQIPGATTLDASRKMLTLTPDSLLSNNTTYTVDASDFADTAGNVVTPFSSSFETGKIEDLAGPVLLSANPANGAADVPVGTSIVLTYDELIDPTSINETTVEIYIPGMNGYIAGSYLVEGSVVTFVPANPLPGGTTIRVRSRFTVRDLAGNTGSNVTVDFTTAATADVTPPEVVMITPADGSADVLLPTPVVLTFSESLNAATITSSNFTLYANGVQLSTGVSRSSDNRTVTLTATYPVSSLITVVVTNDVEDLSGNSLADFISTFTTGIDEDPGAPSVLGQRPANGALGVDVGMSIILYTSEPMDPATVPGALNVAQDGVLVQGAVSLSSDGQSIEFVSDAPFEHDAYVQVFLDPSATDLAGNPLSNYSAYFRTVADPRVQTPFIVRSSPPSGTGGMTLNPVLEAEFNEPLDPATVNSTTVLMNEGGTSGPDVPRTVSLVGDGRIVRVEPSGPLTGGGTIHFWRFTTEIQDLDGVSPTSVTSNYFYTGDVTDNTSPNVVAVSPPDGASTVGVNAVIRVRFDEPINPISVTGDTILVTDGSEAAVPWTISFGTGNTDVTITPHAPLASSALYSLTVDGVTDPSGNAVTPQTTQFSTLPGPDFVRALAVRTNPVSNQVDVPTNPVLEVEFNEPIDPITVTDSTFRLYSYVLGYLPGTTSVSSDGLRLTFAPDGALEVGISHQLSWNTSIRDASGNSIIGGSTVFTTSFASDETAPQLVGVSPGDGLASVPTNAQVVIQFDEPVQTLSVDQVQLSAGGGDLSVTRSLSDSNRRVTLVSQTALEALTEHTVTIDGIVDLSGNALAGPVVTTFTTETGADLIPATVTLTDPLGTTGVPRNVIAEVSFSERINPLTLTSSSFYIQRVVPSAVLAGTVEVAPDGMSATFTPDEPLMPLSGHYVRIYNPVTDLTGRNISSSSILASFTTSTLEDSTGPSVTGVSPVDGLTGVPLNAQVVVQLTELLSAHSIDADAVTLWDGGVQVPGTTTLDSGRTMFTYAPDTLLASNTTYTLNVGGFTDTAGNIATPFSSSFETGTIEDLTGPVLLSTDPISEATDVPVGTSIVLTYDELIDPTSVGSTSVEVYIPGMTGYIAGSYLIEGSVVTFVPANSLPGGTTIRVRSRSTVRDLAGNTGSNVTVDFETEATTDAIPPEVVMITPADGSTDVLLPTPVIVTFSESLNATTINNSNFTLYADGVQLSTSVSRSSDNRTVTLTTSLPASSLITVVVTNDVEDLSENSLEDFVSTFTTTSSADSSSPSILSQRPGSGATGADVDMSIVLYTSEPMDPATVPGALNVSQDGVLIDGMVTLSSDGQTIEFVPDAQFEHDALIYIFLGSSATDLAGNALSNYVASFRTAVDTSLQTPFIVRSSPPSGTGGMTLNPVLEAEFNEPLDPATVNSTTVLMNEGGTSGPDVPRTVSLVGDGRIVRVEPSGPLTGGGTIHFWRFTTEIQDLDGVSPTSVTSNYFYTGDVTDNTSPNVVAVSPPDGASTVGVNAVIRVRFDEPINPISVTGDTILVTDGSEAAVPCTISFGTGNTDVTITPHAPLASSALYSLTVDGVTDPSGNAVTPQTTQFSTLPGPDFVRPLAVRTNPVSNQVDVPTNPVLEVEFNEPIDPITVTDSTFRLYSYVLGYLPGITSVSSDGLRLTFVPDEALELGTNHQLSWNTSIRDVSGNSIIGSSVFFTVSLTEDETAPQVVGVSPGDGFTDVPTNAQVVIQFNEPVQTLSVDQVQLSTGGGDLNVTRTLSDSNRRLTLVSQTALEALTEHTVTIDDIVDLSGNALAGPVVTTFTTGTGADLIVPTVVSTDPAQGATGVPLDAVAVVTFSERMNPFTLSPANFYIQRVSPALVLTGTVVVAADGLSATFTPDDLLDPATNFYIRIFNPITDLTGRNVSSGSILATFTTE